MARHFGLIEALSIQCPFWFAGRARPDFGASMFPPPLVSSKWIGCRAQRKADGRTIEREGRAQFVLQIAKVRVRQFLELRAEQGKRRRTNLWLRHVAHTYAPAMNGWGGMAFERASQEAIQLCRGYMCVPGRVRSDNGRKQAIDTFARQRRNDHQRRTGNLWQRLIESALELSYGAHRVFDQIPFVYREYNGAALARDQVGDG